MSDMTDKRKTLTKNGWSIVLDKDEVFPDDPGQGTPAMLYSPKGLSSTYFCALDNGVIGDHDQPIPRSILDWMEEKMEEIDAFISP